MAVKGLSPPKATPAVNNALAVSFATIVNGHEIQVLVSCGSFLVDSETISLGKDPVAALHSNADLAPGTSTLQRIFPPSESIAVTLNITGHLFTAFANDIAIDGENFTKNAGPITISGTPKLLGLDGLVIGTLTVPHPTLAPELINAAASRSNCPPEWGILSPLVQQ